jgi:hypothetical protein
MMKSAVALFVCCVISFSAESQTRRIAHRSHGGSFHERYDNRDGNYGAVDPRLHVLRRTDTIRTVNGRDSVVRLRDTIIYYYDTTSIHHLPKLETANGAAGVGKNYMRMVPGT